MEYGDVASWSSHGLTLLIYCCPPSRGLGDHAAYTSLKGSLPTLRQLSSLSEFLAFDMSHFRHFLTIASLDNLAVSAQGFRRGANRVRKVNLQSFLPSFQTELLSFLEYVVSVVSCNYQPGECQLTSCVCLPLGGKT